MKYAGISFYHTRGTNKNGQKHHQEDGYHVQTVDLSPIDSLSSSFRSNSNDTSLFSIPVFAGNITYIAVERLLQLNCKTVNEFC